MFWWIVEGTWDEEEMDSKGPKNKRMEELITAHEYMEDKVI